MTKYVKCVDNYMESPSLTIGNSYKILGTRDAAYKILDEIGCEDWFDIDMFAEPYDLPDTITFSSQEDFDNAVMKVVLERLSVSNTTYEDYHSTTTEFTVEDKQ